MQNDILSILNESDALNAKVFSLVPLKLQHHRSSIVIGHDPKDASALHQNDRKVKCIHDHTRILTMDARALLRQAEPELKKRYGVATIGLFGSFVRGEERPESDVDVLVTFRKGQKTFENYMDCKFYLEDLFQRKVDLVLKNTVKSRLKPYILGEVVYA